MNISKTAGICFGLVALVLLALFVLKISFETILLVALVLACPLMHVLMMKKGGHKHQRR